MPLHRTCEYVSPQSFIRLILLRPDIYPVELSEVYQAGEGCQIILQEYIQ